MKLFKTNAIKCIIKTMLLLFFASGIGELNAAINPKADRYPLQDLRVIKGNVTDARSNESLPGVNISIHGTNKGTTTDSQGNYSLEVPDTAKSLVFSFIGYARELIRINGRERIDVALKQKFQEISEVVIVGYGTQKKVNLTGAVDEVKTEAIQNRPVNSLAEALQGVSPNLNIVMPNGRPGGSAEFNIRGITSINESEPLILIDGVPGDPTLLNPEDIESVSVLKDAASSAIYGARGAYGVVLINTKEGKKNEIQVNLSSNYSLSEPTILPNAVTDPYTGMKLYNDSYRGYSGSDILTQDQLDYAKRRSEDPSLPAVVVTSEGGNQNYEYYGNTDWIDVLYQTPQPMVKNDLSISGGSDHYTYFASGGWLTQQGIFNYNADKYNRINFRTKIEYELADWISLNNNLMYNKGIYDAPSFWDNSVDIWRYAVILGDPQYPLKNPDGTWTWNAFPVGFLEDGGRRTKKDQNLQNTVGFELSFFDDKWTTTGKYTYQNDGYNHDIHYQPIYYSTTPGSLSQRGDSKMEKENANNYYHVFNVYSQYENTFGQHYFKGMAGFNQELKKLNFFAAARNDILSSTLGSINLAVGDQYTNSSSSEWALRGIFYRLNYTFSDKYLFEVNGRYDGTSRFPEGDRFGFFPSFSAGWRLSEEDFFQPLSSVFNHLKLRGSYGTLGNQQIQDPYAYIQKMHTGQSGVIIDGQKPTVIYDPMLVSRNLTWEQATTTDVGVDVGMFEDKINASFDWYIRETTDMLTKSKTLPAVLGAEEPRENAANLETKGWEPSLNYRNRTSLFGKTFRYEFGGNLSDYTSKITKFDNPNKFILDYYEGQEFGEIWGFNTLGFFQSEEEYNNHADQSPILRFPRTEGVGDLKWEDKNGDGKIDYGANTVDDPGDRSIIGNTTPSYRYGFNGNFSWNNISVSFFFQGIGERDYFPGGEEAYFWSVYNRYYNTPLKHIVGNYWTPDNRDAYFPRLKAYIALVDGKSLSAPQTRYLQDASYLRLKNLSVGYTLPQALTQRAGIQKIKVFFTGENLWEHTNLKMPVDPESIMTSHSWGDGQTYPFSRRYSIGLDIIF